MKPWKIIDELFFENLIIADSTGKKKTAIVPTKEDAEFIVRAVNNHEELLEALKKSHACATLCDDGTCGGCYVSEAIAKAEGKES